MHVTTSGVSAARQVLKDAEVGEHRNSRASRYSKKTNQEYAFKITNTTDGKKELPPESLSRGERPVNAQLMGKSSGKLLVYLQPSTKNQEERDYRSDLSHDDLARSINFAAPKIISESAGGVAA
ncbi:uncharacterized protein LOC113004787 isoform X2 [Solenopsis invicta]|uniref:uncharacterized protein LOC113004787 isoform X2 n=1 Tax=Solenopsis invicta TaxID=13686 RepID=UPI00193DC2A1|nr:uncharacterized protein LOC113004787 isoform X2 [Solenopsis invicta]XP_039305049.1 uncharacterized protein LOC113004787 isoform X2 [Solenopsis invicta]XP_039305050.1 uncharacterized protein LOC113004787 isoform X2 [Solenopsis invicta]